MKVIALLLLTIGIIMGEDVKFEMTVYIKASKAKVWEAITIPEQVGKYYLCPLRKMGSATGDIVEYGTDKSVFISGNIIKYEKDALLSHSFVFDPASHEGTQGDQPTVVTYEISEFDGVTEVTLRHEGFTEKDQTYANVTGGWPWIISNLKTFLETGNAIK